jgi:hypothetical protein
VRQALTMTARCMETSAFGARRQGHRRDAIEIF